MNARLLGSGMALGAAGLAIGTWLLLRGADPLPATRPQVPRERALAPTDPPQDPAHVRTAQQPGARAAAGTPTEMPPPRSVPQEPAPIEPKTAAEVRGVVVDPQGTPLAGIALCLAEEEPRDQAPKAGTVAAVSALDGTFLVREAPLDRGLFAADPQWATVRAGQVPARQATIPVVVVVAPAIELGGQVVDSQGRAQANLQVSLESESDTWAHFPLALDHSALWWSSYSTDEEGRFRLYRVPAYTGAYLEIGGSVELDSLKVPVPAQTDLSLRLVLDPRKIPQGRRVLKGRVLLAGGNPAEAAHVAWGSNGAQTDARGRFEMRLDEANGGFALIAAKRGLQPAILDGFDQSLKRTKLDPAPVELTLGGPALAIQGRVEDERGKPLRHWSLRLLDGTVAHPSWMPPGFAEHMAGLEYSASTDGEGKFRLEGLSSRSYRIAAWDKDSLLQILSDPIPAGSQDVVLRLPADAVALDVRGQVLDPHGRSVARAVVSVSLRLQDARGWAYTTGRSEETVCDEHGRFRIGQVPRRHVTVTVSGASIIPTEFKVEDLALDEELALRVPLRAYFQIRTATGPEQAKHRVRLEDGKGALVEMRRFEGNGYAWYQWLSLAEGLPTGLCAAEGDYFLVLLEGEQELRRVPLSLTAGQTPTVDL